MRIRVFQAWAVAASLVVCGGCDSGEGPKPSAKIPAPSASDANAIEVEAACGECQFQMPGGGCDLAVRIDGKSYFVTGTKIDEHGDSHAADGFCNAIRRARVTGRVDGDRYAATAFELLPAK